MASSSKGFCAGELDHPEVLSRERLLEILSDRCLPVSEIEHQEKHELVSLFYRFVSPLPQRTRQLKRTTRQPVCATNDGTAGSKRRCMDGHTNPEISNKMSKLDLSWVSITNYKSKKSSNPSNQDNRPPVCGTTQAKAVKLNRKSLGLNPSKLQQHPDGNRSQHVNVAADNNSTFKQVHAQEVETNGQAKKFKRIPVSWP